MDTLSRIFLYARIRHAINHYPVNIFLFSFNRILDQIRHRQAECSE